MKLFIVSLLALAVSGVASAGNPSLCAQGGWQSAQSATGTSFASMPECTKAREVYRPSASISPSHAVAGELFYLNVTGFHPNTHSVVYFAITGEAPYASVTPYYPTDASGNFSIPFRFAECRHNLDGSNVTVNLTLTLVDDYGVHASAQMTLC